MNISAATSRPSYGTVRRSGAAHAPSVPVDQVTLQGSSTQDFGTKTLLGAIPVAGVITNLLFSVENWADGKTLPMAGNIAGIGANAVGTAAVVYGLSVGNQTATYVGLGMLAASGIAAGASSVNI